MESWVKDVEFIIMPSSHPVKGYEDKYEAAYQCWKEAWTRFMNDLGLKEQLHSDGFIIPDEMGVIFYRGECVGLSAYTYGNLRGTLRDHSWFHSWDEVSIERLKKLSDEIMICSQFTIGSKFSGKNQIVRWKDILTLYSAIRFISTNSEVMAGQLNISRKVDGSCGENIGATVIHPNYPFDFHGIILPAQLVAYERNKLHQNLIDRNLISLCEDLWSRTTHLTDYPVIQRIGHSSKAA